MSGREIPPGTKAAARKLAGDRAQPALELVGYDAELSAAMTYAFGQAFVCKVRAGNVWLTAACFFNCLCCICAFIAADP